MPHTSPAKHRQDYVPPQDYPHPSDRAVPITLALLIAAFGAWDVFKGISTFANAPLDHEETIATMWFLGGLYLLLTALWLATRRALSARISVGLTLMLVGIIGGTYFGAQILLTNKDDFGFSQAAFFSGLIVHFLGLLYAKKE